MDSNLYLSTEGTVALTAATPTTLGGGDGTQGYVTIYNYSGGDLYVLATKTTGGLTVSNSDGSYLLKIANGSNGEVHYAKNAVVMGYLVGGGSIVRTVTVEVC